MLETRMSRRVVLVATIWLALLVTGMVHSQQPPVDRVPANVAPHPAPEQPLPFSHRAHLAAGARCEMCHAGSANGPQMTFPASSTCMACHRSVGADRPAIMKLAEFAKSTQPIPWTRVYQVLPGVTWSHRPHVQAGVQCETCHGVVSEMDAMAQVTSVTGMATCVSCHQARQASTACTTCHAWPTS